MPGFHPNFSCVFSLKCLESHDHLHRNTNKQTLSLLVSSGIPGFQTLGWGHLFLLCPEIKSIHPWAACADTFQRNKLWLKATKTPNHPWHKWKSDEGLVSLVIDVCLWATHECVHLYFIRHTHSPSMAIWARSVPLGPSCVKTHLGLCSDSGLIRVDLSWLAWLYSIYQRNVQPRAFLDWFRGYLLPDSVLKWIPLL